MSTPQDLEQWCQHLYEVSLEFVKQFVADQNASDASKEKKKPVPYGSVFFFNSEIPAVVALESLLELLESEYDELCGQSTAQFKEAAECVAFFEELEPSVQCEVLIAATAVVQTNERLIRKVRNAAKEKQQKRISYFVSACTTSEQPWDKPMLALLLKAMRGPAFMNVRNVTELLEEHKKKSGWCEELEALRQPLMEHWFGQGQDSNWDHLTPKTMRLGGRLEKLSSQETEEQTLYEVRDAWTRELSQVLEQYDEQQLSKWKQLLDLCEPAKSSKPSKKFLKAAAGIVDEIGKDSFCESIAQVLSSVGTEFSSPVVADAGEYASEDETLIHVDTANCLRGLVWTCGHLNDAKVYASLAQMADRCFQKIGGHGPRSSKAGNACLWALSQSESLEALAELSNLLPRVKHASSKKQIEKAIAAAAENLGMTRDDLDDQAVSVYFLSEVGCGATTFGEFTAEASIESCSKIQTAWKTPTKTQKTVPKKVKDEFAAELKQYKATEKKLKQALIAQRDRIESFLMADRIWEFPAWTKLYGNHPLLGWFSRRLIWEIHDDKSRSTGIWQGDGFVDAKGKKIKVPAKAKIGIWHPITDADQPELVTAWREYILSSGTTQPFKQAHREVYVLTDAEKQTETYSNRFASHVIKQGQLHALCKARQWKSTIVGNFDSHCLPEKILRHFNLRAEFDTNPIGDDLGDTGLYTYLSTDQVRFYECPEKEHHRSGWGRASREPLPLTEVPQAAFSEVMRDCDLFVGVASVGNDPNWEDAGHDQHIDYWREFSFGELQATAETRREILKSIVPNLKIADRCSFEKKFLVVKGDLRTYKIHFGSSNILMEPNDQYLCIVAKSSQKATKLYLPFEGDQRLSIILSKAIMLAEDKKIKDATIISQIKRK